MVQRKKPSSIKQTTDQKTTTNDLREVDAYTHEDKKRTNNPPAGLATHDKQANAPKTYAYDPHLDPKLDWAGKKEGMSFEVPTTSIHIHESIKPHKIINAVRAKNIDEKGQYTQTGLFTETIQQRILRRQAAIEFYQHSIDWTNRLIAGDSLVIMNSMLEKENMAGLVQMVYIDPPYGIKYGSNFQPFVHKRDVKDGKDEDLSQEPETIKAFRDTWELGIHSYLTYLRNRLLLVKGLLSESGSVFVQISDENVHLVRCICDEVFGVENFVSLITVRKTGAVGSSAGNLRTLGTLGDYIVWYAKNKSEIKYHQLYIDKLDSDDIFSYYNLFEKNGKLIRLSLNEIKNLKSDDLMQLVQSTSVESNGYLASFSFPVSYEGKLYYTAKSQHWSTTELGMKNLIEANRIISTDNKLRYKRKLGDFPVSPLGNIWTDTMGAKNPIYVVQTNERAIARCLLMTTDPGDLTLDITCGSGTTAFVAEQWGRRWITCDTSRVAITLAKKRLMTATYDYYKLVDEEKGVSGDFVYKTVPHVTLKSIANKFQSETETLYDQPEVDTQKVRISGPFTVEALPAPMVLSIEDSVKTTIAEPDDSGKRADWREELLATGIVGRRGERIIFNSVESITGMKYLQGKAETKEELPRKAVICFANETRPLDKGMVSRALDEVEELRPTPHLVIFAAFQFDAEAADLIERTNWQGVTLLQVQMNTDLMTADLKKKRSSDQSFWLVGQPDVELIKIADGADKGKYQVRVLGFDYYNFNTGEVESGNADKVPMWMLDTDYDGMVVVPSQVFFPLGGADNGWGKLAKTLRAEINQDLIECYAGTESLPFEMKIDQRVAVKIIDDRGIESLKIIRAEV